MPELNFDLVLNTKLDKISGELDNVRNQIDQKLKKAGSGADGIGKTIGTSLGKSITSAALASISVGAIVGVFKSIINFDLASIKQYNAEVKAFSKLESSVRNINNSNQRNAAVLNSETASYEQKAKALGYTTDNMYETVKATEAARDASAGYKGQIDNLNEALKQKQRALEDSTEAQEKELKSINDAIKALQKQTEAQIKAIRGSQYDRLKGERQTLDEQINQLEIQKLQAELQGELTFAQDLQIKQLEKQRELTQEQIKSYDLQTDKVKDAADRQEEVLKAKADDLKTYIENQKAQFEIDTKQAKRQLEDLQDQASRVSASISSGGDIKKQRKDIVDQITKQKGMQAKVLNVSEYNNLVNELYDKTRKRFSKGALAQGLYDMLSAGTTEVDALRKNMESFFDIQVDKSQYISSDEALTQLTEQYRTLRGALGETAGLTEEYASDIIPAGIEKLKQMGVITDSNAESNIEYFKTLDQNTKAKILEAGISEIATLKQGKFNDSLNDGTGSLDDLGAAMRELQITLGEKLAPSLTALIYGPDGKPDGEDGLIGLVNNLNKAIDFFDKLGKTIDRVVQPFKQFVNLNKDLTESFYKGDKNKYADTLKSAWSWVGDLFSGKKGFSMGGYTGNLPTDQIAGVVHGQEFVIPSSIYAANKSLIDAIYKSGGGSETNINGSYNQNTYIYGNTNQSQFTSSVFM